MTIPNGQAYDYEMTSAARLAYTFTVNDIGRLVLDQTNGHTYRVMLAGAGAGTMVNTTSGQFGYIPISLSSFREVTSAGDPGDIAANGGVLASDTTPILRGEASESWAIVWAAANADIVQTAIALPPDLDDTRDVSITLVTSSGGTTDAATLTVNTGWDSGTLVVDTATGAAAVALAEATATVAAADVPAAPKVLNIQLVPATHGTDTMLVHSVMVKYYRE